MVHIVPKILKSKRAVIVVGVHSSCDRYTNAAVQEIDGFASKLWPLIKHKYEPAEVEEHNTDNNTVDALQPNVLIYFDVRLQVSKRGHKDNCRVNRLPSIVPDDVKVGICVVWHLNEVVGVVVKAFVPNVTKGQHEDRLNVVRDVRDYSKSWH